jgi:hypothetical protein
LLPKQGSSQTVAIQKLQQFTSEENEKYQNPGTRSAMEPTSWFPPILLSLRLGINQSHIPYIVRACPCSKGECEGLLPENPFISPLPPLPKSKDKPPACCHAAHTWEIGFPPLLRTRLALKSG